MRDGREKERVVEEKKEDREKRMIDSGATRKRKRAIVKKEKIEQR